MTFAFAKGVRAAALAAGWLIVATAGLAAADDDVLYGGNDWYMTSVGVLAIDNSEVDGADPSGGAMIGMGFRFNRWVTAEFAGEWIDQVRYDRGSGSRSCSGTGGPSNGYTAWQLGVGGRVYFTESLIQPFVVGHGSFMETRDHGGGKSCQGNGFAARMGAGVDVFVTNGLAVSLIGTYVLPAYGAVKDHDYVSLGLGLIWY